MFGIEYETAILISNTAIAASCLCIVYIFVTALWQERREWRWFRYREDTAAAIAKIVIFTAGGVSRSSAIMIIKIRESGGDSAWYEQTIHTPITLYASFAFVVGAACLVRVYSETNKEWLALSFFTLGAIGLLITL